MLDPDVVETSDGNAPSLHAEKEAEMIAPDLEAWVPGIAANSGAIGEEEVIDLLISLVPVAQSAVAVSTVDKHAILDVERSRVEGHRARDSLPRVEVQESAANDLERGRGRHGQHLVEAALLTKDEIVVAQNEIRSANLGERGVPPG
jgi:hypothetical protein